MNKYILIDLENNVVSKLNKVDTNFKENEVQTSSITCRDIEDTKGQVLELLYNIRSVLELAIRYKVEYVIDNNEGEDYINLTDKEVNTIIDKATENLLDNIMNCDTTWREVQNSISLEVSNIFNDLKKGDNMKYKYEDFNGYTLEESLDLLEKETQRLEIKDTSLLEDIQNELKVQDENVGKCNELIEQIVDTLNDYQKVIDYVDDLLLRYTDDEVGQDQKEVYLNMTDTDKYQLYINTKEMFGDNEDLDINIIIRFCYGAF